MTAGHGPPGASLILIPSQALEGLASEVALGIRLHPLLSAPTLDPGELVLAQVDRFGFDRPKMGLHAPASPASGVQK